MTLRVPQPSDESIEAVRSRLSELGGRNAFRQRALSRANPAALALAVPHDVYFIGLEDLARGASLDAAVLVGRRFIVMDGDVPIASAELAGDDGSGFQANEGPFVEATAAAISRAEADADLSRGDYEVRMLRVPALYLMSLWLKDEHGNADVLIPLDPAPAPLEAGRRYSSDEVLSALEKPARERLAFDDVGGAPSASG